MLFRLGRIGSGKRAPRLGGPGESATNRERRALQGVGGADAFHPLTRLALVAVENGKKCRAFEREIAVGSNHLERLTGSLRMVFLAFEDSQIERQRRRRLENACLLLRLRALEPTSGLLEPSTQELHIAKLGQLLRKAAIACQLEGVFGPADRLERLANLPHASLLPCLVGKCGMDFGEIADLLFHLGGHLEQSNRFVRVPTSGVRVAAEQEHPGELVRASQNSKPSF